MKPQPSLNQTTEFVRSLFDGIVDKGGHPYVDHCIRVMEGLPPDATIDERHAALLHDVLEDLPVTRQDLEDIGYSERTIWLVEMLTRPDDVTYLDYIRSLKATGDGGLIAIKLSDNRDNSDPERIAQIPEAQRGIADRYRKARNILVD